MTAGRIAGLETCRLAERARITCDLHDCLVEERAGSRMLQDRRTGC
ncbi:hypothetical protein M2164_008413 [Streptomyces sp. SAI-208]|nr:hypothetical protein [Streptomyces sp. SAI-208]